MTMLNNQLDFSADERLAGFRLQRFEVLNWGTFDRRVWHIGPNGHNALITGDIGSGKSTLVDALTTLLVPAQRIIYNKAAGAELRERNLTSYVKGYYKSEKDESRLAAKAVSLREDNSYSVLLAWFYNEGFDSGVCLAQVYWMKDNKTTPERFYVVSEQSLSIAEEFSQFGSDILDLKRRLRKNKHTTLYDSFSQYSSEFRRRLGIQNSQAMNLFYQTVSMKSVGNLTEFVRDHMLEPAPIDERIENICNNFSNLNQAHESVLKAKDQIDALQPLISDCDKHQVMGESIHLKTRCREMLYAWFAQHKINLLESRIMERQNTIARLQDKVDEFKRRRNELHQQQLDLQKSMADNGGNRLAEIELEIQRLQQDLQRKQGLAAEYTRLCEKLQFPASLESEVFHRNRQTTITALKDIEKQEKELHESLTKTRVEMKLLNDRYNDLQKEIDSLRQRQSNIPLRSLQTRELLCTALGVEQTELPFVGELVEVRSEEQDWEGAIERILHNFGLSILVPDHLYRQVSQYVNDTHLRGRLVYYRVAAKQVLRHEIDSDFNLLYNKLRIKPDSEFYSWLEKELAARFGYTCCDTLEAFMRLPKAVTNKGQIKSGHIRHEKDDRHPIDDRSRYVLGWDNKSKIQALEEQQTQLQHRGSQYTHQVKKLDEQITSLKNHRDACRDLGRIQVFEEIHWQPTAVTINALKQEYARIEQASDILKTLKQQLEQAKQNYATTEEKLESNQEKLSSAKIHLLRDKEIMAESRDTLAGQPQEERHAVFPILEEMQQQDPGNIKLSIENADKRQSELRSSLQARIDNEKDRLSTLGERITKHMLGFKNRFPLETREFDDDLRAANEYRQLLAKLLDEDLPRHEDRFKTLLNEGTIQDMAMFQSQLDKERQDILDNIDVINISLREIEYTPGSYIEIAPDRSLDQEIRQFQEDLRACLGDTLAGSEDELYTENKFHQVKSIIDRFNGREGTAELDRKWTGKVTDVRFWFTFSAVERWQEDGSEKEFYSDSSGKSGGQKEKLAYTILASALAYQFGLKWGDTRSRSFRFVMIDEAFGRGSDESTRYGLELFNKLNLQLLIVTPLQKIHVIEDYVRSVHFIHNEDGSNSMIRNLSIEDYREEKARFQSLAAL